MCVCVGNGIIHICDLVCGFVTHLNDNPGETEWAGGRDRGTGLGASLIFLTFCYVPWNDLLCLYQFENRAAAFFL